MKTALSIAGTDPSGGAGIQADLKTMTMNGAFAMSAMLDAGQVRALMQHNFNLTGEFARKA